MSFVARYRVAVKKFLYFQKRLAKLGPAYFDCNERQSSCTRRSAQPRQGCPNCEFTVQTKIFHAELDQLLKNVKGGTRKGERRWPRDVLLKLCVEAGSFANRESPDPNWPVTTALMVSIYRDESAKIKAIDNFNLTAGSDDKPRKGPQLKIPLDADEGDFD